eukprot:3789565-Amphidinium_carterae.1
MPPLPQVFRGRRRMLQTKHSSTNAWRASLSYCHAHVDVALTSVPSKRNRVTLVQHCHTHCLLQPLQADILTSIEGFRAMLVSYSVGDLKVDKCVPHLEVVVDFTSSGLPRRVLAHLRDTYLRHMCRLAHPYTIGHVPY